MAVTVEVAFLFVLTSCIKFKARGQHRASKDPNPAHWRCLENTTEGIKVWTFLLYIHKFDSYSC